MNRGLVDGFENFHAVEVRRRARGFIFLMAFLLAACGPTNPIESDQTSPGSLIRAMAPYIPEYDGRTEQEMANNVRIVEGVKDLVEAGANVNFSRTDGGYTPLHVATMYKEPELVWLFLKHGADPDARTTIGDKMTPLELARKAQEKTGREYSQVIRLLQAVVHKP